MRAVRVLIIGGGVAGLEGTLALRALAGERVSTCVIAPEKDFEYRPLAVAEPFRAAEMRMIALRSLVSAAEAELIPARVTAVDAKQHLVGLRKEARCRTTSCSSGLGRRRMRRCRAR